MQDEIMELINEFEERLQEFREEYIESKTDFEFEKGETYWSILRDGQVMEFEWRVEEYYVACYEQGNVFKTREEALFEAEKRKVLHELKQLGRGFRPNKNNYYICLHHDSQDNQKKLFYKAMTEVEHVYGDYYFDSLPKAKDAVYRIGEERIMKYLFRAED